MRLSLRPCIDFLLPPWCRICQASTAGEASPWVCQSCWEAIEYLQPPWCAQCGQPFAAPEAGIASPSHRCGACMLTPPAYDRAGAVGRYEGVLRHIIHLMKYQSIYGLVRPLGDLLLAQFATHWDPQPPEALLPVPLHRKKLRSREFDQALALARHVSHGTGIPVWTDVLIRSRHTRPQVGLSAVQRRRNIRGAFTVRAPQRCQDKALLLIDDVYTTGATVQECARLLRQAGAASVDVYTLARVDTAVGWE